MFKLIEPRSIATVQEHIHLGEVDDFILILFIISFWILCWSIFSYFRKES